jgi:hypothetical protein
MDAQLGLNFTKLEPYMRECEAMGHVPESMSKMRAIVRDDGNLLQLELAMNMDAFEPFVQYTFKLEGDGVLVFAVTDCVEHIDKHVQTVRSGMAGAPRTRAVAQKIVADAFGGELAAGCSNRARAAAGARAVGHSGEVIPILRDAQEDVEGAI